VSLLHHEGDSLTMDGKLYADQVNLKTLKVRRQPKIVTLVAVQNSKDQWLLYKRKHQPLINQIGFPYGKLHLGETVQEAAERAVGARVVQLSEQVEELCESIAIVDRGKVVVSGALRDVKRAMGRQVVRLATDGNGSAAEWLSLLPGVTLTAEREDFVELRVPADQDPETILRAALDRGDRITRFEIAEPSLEEIFVEHVGRRAVSEEEEHLATTTREAGS
jgi:hypothetical protein